MTVFQNLDFVESWCLTNAAKFIIKSYICNGIMMHREEIVCPGANYFAATQCMLHQVESLNFGAHCEQQVEFNFHIDSFIYRIVSKFVVT